MIEPWSRAIILMDLNAFFASIEQLDHPELRGRPVAVTNGEVGTCIITCSYEARHFGVKTGMRIYQARRQCPFLVQVAARPDRYAEVSSRIMEALHEITPDIEIFSVDEAFLDVTHCQKAQGLPIDIARRVKAVVYRASGLLCSVGISGDKTTAKFAAKLQKPDGLTLIHPDDAENRLSQVPVTELCGINKGIGGFLASHGVFVCGDMKRLPISVLAKRFGPLGRRLWWMAQGKDPLPVQQSTALPKSVGHGKVLPPNTDSKEVILTYLRHMAEKVAARLRRYDLEAQTFFIALRHFSALSKTKLKLQQAGNDGMAIFHLCQFFIEQQWSGDVVLQVQLTALDPHEASLQMGLFDETDPRRDACNAVMDTINRRFGAWSLTAASLLNRSSMPNVIAPSWRPDGIRQSV